MENLGQSRSEPSIAAFLHGIVGLEAAVIAGQSSGGYTAQRFAVDHPERTLGLVLIGTPRDFRDKPASLKRTVSELTDPVDPQFVREFAESTITQPMPPVHFDMLIAECCKVPARVWKATFEGLVEAEVPTESGTITAPTLILWGDQDQFCSRSEQEGMAGAELVTYHGTGHAVACEQPARTAADLAAFARRVHGIKPGATIEPSA